MINRREFVAGLAAVGIVSQAGVGESNSRIDIGLELYSLRADMKRDVPGTLALAKQMGFHHVEVPSYYGLTAVEFRAALDKAGLKATALVAQYQDLKNNVDNVQHALDVLGAKWAILPWIDHGDTFTREDVERTSNDMNSWSATLTKNGYKFAYHPHGYEFYRSPEGTLFDTLCNATNPDTVKFEMDTFWIMQPGQDCVALLKKYPTRFRLLHLKDLRKGAKIGELHGLAPETDSVPIGEGLVPWKGVLALAKQQKFEGYYIEDEHPDAARQIPGSLRYLAKENLL